MDGLECSEIYLSALERTHRIDAEFYSKKNLRISALLNCKDVQPFTESFRISDGNHMSISESFCEKGVPYYRGQDIYSTFIEQASPVCIDKKTFHHPHMKRSHLKRGDVLLSIVGTVGKSAIVSTDADATCSCKLAIMRNSKNGIMPEVLLTFIKTEYGQNQIQKFKRGAVQTGLLLEDFDQLFIPNFSADFQEFISVIINKSHEMTLRGNTAYLCAHTFLLNELRFDSSSLSLGGIAQKRMSESFFVSGRLDAEYYQPKYDDYYTLIDSYPGGWSVIGKEFSYINTKCNRAKKAYNYIEIGDVDVSMGIAMSNRIDTPDLPDNAKIITQKGDIIVSTVRPNRGAVAILAENGLLVSGAFTVLRESGSYKKEVLQTLLRTELYRDWLLRYNVGTSYPVIKDNDVLNMPIPLLPYDVQREIAQKVRESFSLRRQAETLIETAVKAVEIAIEQDEAAAVTYMEQQSTREGL